MTINDLKPTKLRLTEAQKLKIVQSAWFTEVLLPQLIKRDPPLYQELLALYDLADREANDELQARLRQLVAVNKLKIATRF